VVVVKAAALKAAGRAQVGRVCKICRRKVARRDVIVRHGAVWHWEAANPKGFGHVVVDGGGPE
jgi:hypothetical protein